MRYSSLLLLMLLTIHVSPAVASPRPRILYSCSGQSLELNGELMVSEAASTPGDLKGSFLAWIPSIGPENSFGGWHVVIAVEGGASRQLLRSERNLVRICSVRIGVFSSSIGVDDNVRSLSFQSDTCALRTPFFEKLEFSSPHLTIPAVPDRPAATLDSCSITFLPPLSRAPSL